jgi:hypothetical protein
MMYAKVDTNSGRILSLSNRNLFGGDAFTIELDAPLTDIVENWYVRNGVLTARPHLNTPDSLSFSDGEAVLVPCPDDSRVLGFDAEFLSTEGVAVVAVSTEIDEFELTVIPPFPYREKIVKVSLPRRVSTL